MTMRIQPDAHAPSTAVELPIRQPLPDYDLDEIEASIPRDVDVMLASQGFLDLLDEARGILTAALGPSGLELIQLTGAICGHGGVHGPGLWLVFREAGAAPGQPMSATAQARVAAVAEQLRTQLQLG
jgi:hypothetical protein